MKTTKHVAITIGAVLFMASAVALAWQAGEIHAQHEFASVMTGAIAALCFIAGLTCSFVTVGLFLGMEL